MPIVYFFITLIALFLIFFGKFIFDIVFLIILLIIFCSGIYFIISRIFK
jgi:hypothetical protein